MTTFPAAEVMAAGWVALLSLIAFAACLLDKARAGRAGAGRVPEATLLGLALVGGTPGLVLGMALARHKTRKPGFLLPLAGILAIQLGVLLYVYSL
jgi:uncharacterized membrane protein YsdA (DUF1294 family)